MKTLPEKLTYIGLMLTDLRGSWGDRYEERIELVIEEILSALKMDNLDNDMKKKLKETLVITTEELVNIENDEEDGRIFRDCAPMYNYTDDNLGVTLAVRDRIEKDMTYPENCFITDIDLDIYPEDTVSNIQLTEEGIIDTISGLTIISNITFLRNSTDLENLELIWKIEEEGVRYGVCGDKKVFCITNTMVVKCPATYYDNWTDVPKKYK
jgi:hypothetical protein